MLYKVTPMMGPPTVQKAAEEKKAKEPGQPRKRRKSSVYDAEGHEVLITLMCLKCRQIKPLMQFGLRKMADGAIRNQPWCRTCRSTAGTPKAKKGQQPEAAATAEVHEEAVAAPALVEAPEAEPAPLEAAAPSLG